MSSDEQDRVFVQVANKAVREQSKRLAVSAALRAVEQSARQHRYINGFVEWVFVQRVIDAIREGRHLEGEE